MGARFYRPRPVDGEHRSTGDLPQLTGQPLPLGGGGFFEAAADTSMIAETPVEADADAGDVTTLIPTAVGAAHT